MAVNISPRRLDSAQLAGELTGVLAAHDLTPGSMVIEFAETRSPAATIRESAARVVDGAIPNNSTARMISRPGIRAGRAPSSRLSTTDRAVIGGVRSASVRTGMTPPAGCYIS